MNGLPTPTSVSLGKLIVPVYISDFDDVIGTLVIIESLRVEKKITSQQATGYKACVTKENYQSIREALRYKYMDNQHIYSVYANLNFVYQVDKRSGMAWIPDLSILYKRYAEMYANQIGLDRATENFFKYCPFLLNGLNLLGHIRGNDSSGYCCEDCDGDLKQYMGWRFHSDMNSIAHELDKLKINV